MSIQRPVLASTALLLLAGSLLGCASEKSSPAPGTGAPLELNSGDIAASASYAHRFFTAGDFPYHCRYHGVMTGTVTVNDAAPDSVATVTIVSSSSPFPAASVRPGGRVTWVNNTGMTHTVTSN